MTRTMLPWLVGLTALSLACGDKDDDDGGDSGGAVDADVDADGDGFPASEDCDDDDAAVYPGAAEVCDGVDNDCDDLVDDADDGVDLSTGTTFYGDGDGDGYGATDAPVEACALPAGAAEVDGDCDDANSAINPGAAEVCDPDDVDEDCSGAADDADAGVDPTTQTPYYADGDSDGFGDEADAGTLYCDPPSGVVTDNSDCDDGDGDINPDAVEVCDELDVDEDCSGAAEDADPDVDPASQTLYYVDGDTDGYGDEDDPGTLYCDPPSGVSADNTDCDDAADGVNPGATEVCDDLDVDEDCSGLADDDDAVIDTTTYTTWYADTDSDGYGDFADAGLRACDAPAGTVADNTDCDDTDGDINPDGTEICDGVDNDCDRATSENGMVSFEDSAGAMSDVSATFTAGTAASPAAVTASSAGTYRFCDGTYYTNIEVTADVTLRGQSIAAVLDGGGTDSTVYVQTDGLSVAVEDLTVQGGVASSVLYLSTLDGGGNLACQGSSALSLSNVEVTGGDATLGGGIYIEECTLDASDSVITDNTSDYGGGLFIYDSSAADLTDSEVTLNESGLGGGAYLLGDVDLDLDYTVFSENIATSTATAGAGGILSYPTTATSIRCQGDSSGTYGFVNHSTGVVGVYAYEGTSFEAVECDFGTALDGAANSLYGLYVADAEWLLNYGNDVSFSCDATDGCGDQTTTSLGTSSSPFAGDDRIRGNIFLATDDGSIDDFGLQLDPDASCDLDFYVLSNSARQDSGWSVEWSSTGNSVGTGDDLYEVSGVGLAVEAGTYYAIVVGWMCADAGDRVGYSSNTSTSGAIGIGTHEGNVQQGAYTTTLSGTGVSLTTYGSSGVYDGSVTVTAF